jgi:YesN/AraC family two-component response regulator
MLKVLIVDDEYIARFGLKSCIPWEASGFELVGTADDGISALEIIKEARPHIVIADIKMPRMDGIELLKLTRAFDKNVCFIMLTCLDDVHSVKTAIKAGADDYISKLSMRPEELLSILANMKANIERQVECAVRNEIAKAKQYIAEHVDERITLKQVAKACALSPTYFSSLFKKECHESFVSYVNRIKMERARDLILIEKMQFGEAAYHVGILDNSYFCKLFRKHMGTSPGGLVPKAR